MNWRVLLHWHQWLAAFASLLVALPSAAEFVADPDDKRQLNAATAIGKMRARIRIKLGFINTEYRRFIKEQIDDD